MSNEPTIEQMNEAIEQTYYLYRHIRKDTNQVFYIGIGTKWMKYPNNEYRIYHRAYTKNYRNKWWRNIVNKTPYSVEVIFETNDRELIKVKESEFILLYGRKDLGNGTLVNLDAGGVGSNGRVLSSETKAKMRAKKIGIPLTGSHLVNLRAARSKQTFISPKGKENKRSKPVIQLDIDGNYLREFGSIGEAATTLKHSKSGIISCLKGKIFQNSGARWAYKI